MTWRRPRLHNGPLSRHGGKVRKQAVVQDFTTSQAHAVWHGRMEDFLYDCAASAAIEEADRIREACRLLAQPPAAIAPQGEQLVARPVPADAIAAMLEAGAAESAVMALLAPEVGYMLSRGGNGVCLASVVLPDGTEEVTAEGSTLALALLAGLVSAVLAGREEGRHAGDAAAIGASARLN